MNQTDVPIWEKYTLTIEEAAKYFRIGENKLRKLAEENPNANWVILNGNRIQIKRKQFEKMIDIMSRDDRGLNVGGAPLLSPETGCAQIGFRITGTDATGLHFDDDFALSRPRDIHLFNTIILRGMGHQGPHFFGQIHHLVSPPHVTLKDTLLDVKNTQDRYNGRKRVLPPVMKTL